MVPFRSYLAGLALALCSATASLGAEDVRGEEVPPVVISWLNAQTNIQTWSADVTQIRTLKTLAQPLSAKGHVWFAAPNRFRWEIGKPAQTIAVRKPEEMLVIYPRLKRAERYSFSSQQNGPWRETLALLEAGFPRNENDLHKQFKIGRVTSSNSVCALQLEPKSTAGRHMMPHLTVGFGTDDFMLRFTELEFADGSTMRNEFSNPQLNPSVDESLFNPKIGPEYNLVEPMKH